jgi:uncharacterized protein YciI
MRYFVIESTFNDPLPVGAEELHALIREHQRYLTRGFEQRWILLSGPKAAAGGGVIVMRMPSLADVERYLAEDPMKLAGVQEDRPIEFKLHDCQPEVRQWFR